MKGGKSKAESNAENEWLLKEEERKVIKYAGEMAYHGFPLRHRRLKEHIDAIPHARLCDAFPKKGVGVNWMDHFMEKHSNELGTYWSSPLDSAHGCAVNTTTNKAYFDLLEDTIMKNNIDVDL